MSDRIDFKTFEGYARGLIQKGACVCPCCLGSILDFTTDENHQEYWLECSNCKVGIRNFLFSNVYRKWNTRNSKDSVIHKRTHNIDCSYWDDENKETLCIENFY